MAQEPKLDIHSDIHRLLEENHPGHPMDREFWRRVAAEVSESYRPEISDPYYRDFIAVKLRYLITGDSPDVQKELRRIRNYANASTFAVLRKSRGLPVPPPEDYEFYREFAREMHVFDRYLLTEAEVHDLEGSILRALSIHHKLDFVAASATDRSSAFLDFLKSTGEAWDGLPNNLAQHVVEQFPDRIRDGGFWKRIQSQIGYGFSPELLKHPEYVDLLNLQILAYGFQADPAPLRALTKSFQERLVESPNLPSQVLDKMTLEAEDLLVNLRTMGNADGPPTTPRR